MRPSFAVSLHPCTPIVSLFEIGNRRIRRALFRPHPSSYGYRRAQIVPAVLLVDPEPADPGIRLSHDTYLLKKPINLTGLTRLVSTLRERANKLLRG